MVEKLQETLETYLFQEKSSNRDLIQSGSYQIPSSIFQDYREIQQLKDSRLYSIDIENKDNSSQYPPSSYLESSLLPTYRVRSNEFEPFPQSSSSDFPRVLRFSGAVALDNLEQVFAGFFDKIGILPGDQAVGVDILSLGADRPKKLNFAYSSHLAEFTAQLKPALDTIKALSTSRVAGTVIENGVPVPRLERVDRNAIEPGDTLAYTHFSLSTLRESDLRMRFYDGIRRSDLPSSLDNLFEHATILADPTARSILRDRLKNIRETRTRNQQAEELYVDVAFLGASVHTSNAATVLRALRPDLTIAAIDKLDDPGQLWYERGWFNQNNTMNRATNEGGNLPRQQGDLFPLGNFGAMRMPYITDGSRWPTGDLAGIAIDYNLTRDVDTLLMSSEVTEILPLEDRVQITLERPQGRQVVYANKIIVTGASRPKNPFMVNGNVLDAESVQIWEEETAKSNAGEQALCYTFDGFSQAVSTVKGREQFFGDPLKGQITNGFIGDKDGGNCLELYSAGLSASGYTGVSTQTTLKPKSVWWGQSAQTADDIAKVVRSVYAQVCAAYTSESVTPVANKIGAIRRSGNKLVGYALTEQGIDFSKGYEMNTLVSAAGNEQIPDEELVGLYNAYGQNVQNRTTRYDSEGRPVMTELADGKIGFIGPSAQIPVADLGVDVKRVFKQLDINENEVANWARGWASQRAAVEIAKEMPASTKRDFKGRSSVYNRLVQSEDLYAALKDMFKQ